MLVAAHRDWWSLALRGLFAILFGVMVFVWPGITLLSLVLLWGIYAVLEGIAAIMIGLHGRWWWMAIVGVLGVIAGIIAFVWPHITALLLLYLIAAAAVIRGISEIIAAIELRKAIEGEWLLILAGLLSVAFGILLFVHPGAGALAVLWIIGVYAIAFGIIEIAASLRLRKLQSTGGPAGIPASPAM